MVRALEPLQLRKATRPKELKWRPCSGAAVEELMGLSNI